MIMTVDELRQYVNTDETDAVLEARLSGIESAIRAYTNNKFHERGTGVVADVASGVFMSETFVPYEEGDTVQISGSDYNNGLYTVDAVLDDTTFRVHGKTMDDIDQYVIRVKYPPDVKMGAVGLLAWDLEHRGKAGIQSETISRHSISYMAMNGDNALMGYPLTLAQFLKPYMKARFGWGLDE